MEWLAFIATFVVLLCAILATARLLLFRTPEYKGPSNFETFGFDTLPVGVVITDPNQPDNPIVYCNSAFQNITGYSRNEIIGRNCRFLQGEDKDQAGIQTLRSALVEKRVCTVTLRNYRKDNTMFWNEVTISPIFDEQGHTMFNLGLQQDVTHRQQDTVALQEQNQRLAMNQGTLLELARYDENNLENSLQKYLMVAAVQLATPRVSLWRLDESKQELSCTLMIRHGELTTENQSILIADQPLFYGALQNNQIIIISDLTDTLSRLDIDLNYIIERNISAAMYIPININRELVGFIGHEQIGAQRDWTRDDREFSRYIADLCAVALIAEENQEATRKLEETERLLAEARKVGQLGSFIWYYQNDRLVFSNDIIQVLDLKNDRPNSMLELCERIRRDSQSIFMTDARQAISDHNERWEGIYPFSASNSETRYCEVVAQVSELNDQIGLRGTIQDVTTRVLTEKENESLRQRILQAEKLETIGTLARGIAHDFNNLLTPLIGYAELLAADYDEGDRQLNYTNEIIHSGIRAKQLIEQLLIFSAHRQAEHPEIDILPVLEDIVQSIRPRIDCSVMLEANLDKGSLKIRANSGQLRQILTNLCLNANSAMQGQGTILINSFTTTASALPESRKGDKRSFLAIQVEDSGPGISDSYVEHIFEPFFTTREVGAGTGLGLSVVHGIVKQHAGEISVNSKPGHTSITIFLPYEPESPNPELINSN